MLEPLLRQPDVDEGDAVGLYLLRRHLGIDPADAYLRRPAWEVDLLIAGVRAEFLRDEDGAGAGERDPWAGLPEPDLGDEGEL